MLRMIEHTYAVQPARSKQFQAWITWITSKPPWLALQDDEPWLEWVADGHEWALPGSQQSFCF